MVAMRLALSLVVSFGLALVHETHPGTAVTGQAQARAEHTTGEVLIKFRPNLKAGQKGRVRDRDTSIIMKTFLETLRLAPSWVTIVPASGTVPPGGRADLTVTLDATGLSRGSYDADLLVFSNDPDESQVVTPSRLHVRGGGAPRRRMGMVAVPPVETP